MFYSTGGAMGAPEAEAHMVTRFTQAGSRGVQCVSCSTNHPGESQVNG